MNKFSELVGGAPPLPIGVTRTMYHVTPKTNLDSIMREGLHNTALPLFLLPREDRESGYIYLSSTDFQAEQIAVAAVWNGYIQPQEFVLLKVTVLPYVPLFLDPKYASPFLGTIATKRLGKKPISFIAGMPIQPENIEFLTEFDLSNIEPWIEKSPEEVGFHGIDTPGKPFNWATWNKFARWRLVAYIAAHAALIDALNNAGLDPIKVTRGIILTPIEYNRYKEM